MRRLIVLIAMSHDPSELLQINNRKEKISFFGLISMKIVNCFSFFVKPHHSIS